MMAFEMKRGTTTMHLVRGLAALGAGAALMATLGFATESATDCDGCRDAAWLGRYPGSQLVGYDERAFDESVFLIRGATTDDEASAASERATVAGRRTELFYFAPEGRSGLEVFLNYQKAVQQAGFQTVWSCSGDAECGAEFGNHAVESMHLDVNNTTEAREGTADAENARYLVARKDAAGGAATYVAILAMDLPLHAPPRAGAYVLIGEPKAMDTGLATVAADAMHDALITRGKVDLYGIEFDFDSDTLRPSSEPQLRQIAALLSAHPELALDITGHTDDRGAPEYNMNLSRRRAQAVVRRLSGGFGISADRLHAFGLGDTAPIAGNDTEAGRQKNRRVELSRTQ